MFAPASEGGAFLGCGRDSPLQAAAKALEPFARIGVESVANSPTGPALLDLRMSDGFEIGQKRPRCLLADFLAGGPPHEGVGGDDADEL